MLIFIYMLLLPEGQKCEAWKLPKNNSFGNREEFARPVLALFQN